MAEDIPSLSSGVVGSRFVSQSDIDSARARRDEQWKAAYSRLGQEPPPQPQEDAYDGRSLAEKLAANRAAKQEEWEEKTKLANQFRALEEDEIMFLDAVRERQEEEERDRKMRDGEELKSFREAVASKVVVKSPPPPPPLTSSESISSKPPPGKSTASTAPTKKPAKKPLKGVVVKKKPKVIAQPKASQSVRPSTPDDAPPDAKRRRVSESGS
ncbi:N-terminal domain of NEFA-interacting nuclear protein NIP30-domain-containing protein [Amylostereum chailletii]|nr:N-terminal domain of NEFA-interacting nuclear protein NIP30-domain-containing protein [Amylostereum chailletii]